MEDTIKCKKCNTEFNKNIEDDPCHYHDGQFHESFGTYGDIIDYWTCCKANNIDAKGCKTEKHLFEIKKCKKCKKIYNDATNTHLSCTHHSSCYHLATGNYGDDDDFWICCLKSDIDSIGCTISKHVEQ